MAASANVTAGSALANLLNAQGNYNVSSVTFNINGAHTLTKGFDLRLEHSDPIGALGTLHWTLASNQNVTKVKSLAALPAIIGTASAGTLRTQFTSYYPKNISSIALRWELEKLNVWVKATRWCPTTYRGASAALDEHQSPAVTFDANVNYDVTECLGFSVGGTNVLNKKPDRISAQAQALQFISGTEVAPYNRYAPFGLDGGFYYARLDVKW